MSDQSSLAPQTFLVSRNATDGEMSMRLMADNGISAHAFSSLREVARLLDERVACLILVEDVLVKEELPELREAINRLPAWVDLPLIAVAGDVTSFSYAFFQAFPESGNVTFLQRPLNPHTLISAVRVALRANARQRQVGELLADRGQAVKARDEFLAILAHELRNPLAPLRNGLEVIRLSSGQQATVDKTREMMERQLGHLGRLVDDLLDINRIIQGKVELHRERLNLVDIINQAVETVRPLIDQRRHRLTTAIAPGDVFVDGDVTRLVQVIANLLNNACKYTPSGGEIRIEVQAQHSEAVIRIADNGIGIPAAMQPRIFDLFTQVHNSLESVGGGLGIGLSLVKSLVLMHGGSVTAFSEGGKKGSELVLRLPLSESIQEVPEALPETPVCERRRVLVVDDNVDAAVSLAELLNLIGHSTRVAHSGAEALEAGMQFLPDAVFLDIGMPGMTGYDCARLIRAAEWGKDAMLTALTGWNQAEDRQKSKQAGFDHHLVKPASLDSLISLLKLRDVESLR